MKKILLLITGLILIVIPAVVKYDIPGDYYLNVEFVNDTDKEYFVALTTEHDSKFYFQGPLVFPIYKSLLDSVEPQEKQITKYEAMGAGGSLLILAKDKSDQVIYYYQIDTSLCINTVCEIKLSDFTTEKGDNIIGGGWGITWFIIRPFFYVAYLFVAIIIFLIDIKTYNIRWKVSILATWIGVLTMYLIMISPALIWDM